MKKTASSSSVAEATDNRIGNGALPAGTLDETAGAILEDSSSISNNSDYNAVSEDRERSQEETSGATIAPKKGQERSPSSVGPPPVPGSTTWSASEVPSEDCTNTNSTISNEATTTHAAVAAPFMPPSTKESSSWGSLVGHSRKLTNVVEVKRPLCAAAISNRLTTAAATAVGSGAAAQEGGAMDCDCGTTEQRSAMEEVDVENGTLSIEPRQFQGQQNQHQNQHQEHQNNAAEASGGNRREQGGERLSPASMSLPAASMDGGSSDPPAPQGDEETLQQSEPANDDPEPSQDGADDETRRQAPGPPPLMEHAPSSLSRGGADESYSQDRQDLPLAVPVPEPEPPLHNQEASFYGSEAGAAYMSSAVVQAQPLEDWKDDQRENKKCCSKENGAGWLSPTQWAVGGLLLVVLIVVGVVIGVTQAVGGSSGGSSDGIAAATDAPISDGATFTPTTTVDDLDIASSPPFPPFSNKLHFLALQALADPTSAQSRANSWMMQDPIRDTYEEPRQLQRFALASLYYSTRGDRWERNDLWLDYEQDECQWYNQVNQEIEGAICDENSHIIRLNLSGNGLNGVLPVELFFFPALASLDLSHNELIGTAPTMFAGAGNLKRLVLSSNQLTGQFTAELGFVASQLAVLHNNDNLFTGALPGLIRLLPKLYDLNITGNQYSGSLPSSLIQLSNTLTVMEVADNSITGELPSELGMATHLQRLDVGRNAYLQGTIPSELSALVNLTSLNIDGTRVSGSLPSALCGFEREGRLQVEADCAGQFQCCNE
jgi:hypothetical protein